MLVDKVKVYPRIVCALGVEASTELEASTVKALDTLHLKVVEAIKNKAATQGMLQSVVSLLAQAHGTFPLTGAIVDSLKCAQGALAEVSSQAAVARLLEALEEVQGPSHVLPAAVGLQGHVGRLAGIDLDEQVHLAIVKVLPIVIKAATNHFPNSQGIECLRSGESLSELLPQASKPAELKVLGAMGSGIVLHETTLQVKAPANTGSDPDIATVCHNQDLVSKLLLQHARVAHLRSELSDDSALENESKIACMPVVSEAKEYKDMAGKETHQDKLKDTWVVCQMGGGTRLTA